MMKMSPVTVIGEYIYNEDKVFKKISLVLCIIDN